MAPEEQTCPAAWQASGSAETEPSSDLEATHLTLSLWRDPPPLCQVISTSEHQRRPEPVPRGCHVPPSLESNRRPVTDEATGGRFWDP